MMYQELSEVLAEINADIEAAEAQGIAVGMLVVEIRADVANWLLNLLAGETVDDATEQVLVDFFAETRQMLLDEHDEYDFDLLLPDDDAPLDEQVEALRLWCQGFLLGIGYSITSTEWPGEIGEIMRDMIELTKMDNDVAGEEDANALMEIREYVRAAVFTVKDTFLEMTQEQQH